MKAIRGTVPKPEAKKPAKKTRKTKTEPKA